MTTDIKARAFAQGIPWSTEHMSPTAFKSWQYFCHERTTAFAAPNDGGSAALPSSKPARMRIVQGVDRAVDQRGIKGVIAGVAGIGKTSLLRTLPAEKTLFINVEAGDLSVAGWPGDELRVRDWELARDVTCWIGGVNPAVRADHPYGAHHYKRVCAEFGDPGVLGKYDTIFIDSITVLARLCLQWCKAQPQAMTANGKPDTRAAYGLLGLEMITWLTHLQHVPHKNVWLVGILDRRHDELNRPFFALQLEGSKTALELPGIVDQVITMAEVKGDDGKPKRAFICTTINPYGYPAKDRSGRLDTIEEPHLGQLMEKIRQSRRDK